MQKILPMVVLIATHNRNSLLERTIESLNACILPEHRSVKLIVVENGGRYGAEDVVKRNQSNLNPEYRYFEMGNKSAALNFVISSLPDSIIIFLDDDVRVEPSFLAHYSYAIGNKTGGFFFGGGLLVDYELPPPKWLIDFLPISAQGWHPKEHAPMGDLYFFGANWAAFSHDILMLDGFDPNYGPGGLSGGTGQETAMQKRFIANNIKYIYIYDAVVWHFVSATRSSPEWVLDRAYRNGITEGFSAFELNNSKKVLKIFLWMIRKRVVFTFQGIWYRFTKTEQEYFFIRHKLNGIDGYIWGILKKMYF